MVTVDTAGLIGGAVIPYAIPDALIASIFEQLVADIQSD